LQALFSLKYPLDFLGSTDDPFHVLAQLDNDSPVTGYDVLGMGQIISQAFQHFDGLFQFITMTRSADVVSQSSSS